MNYRLDYFKISGLLILFNLAFLLHHQQSLGFVMIKSLTQKASTAALSKYELPTMMATKAKKKSKVKSKAKGGAKVSLKGFGSRTQGKLITSPEYTKLYEWLQAGGVDLSRVGIADFDGLRGVMALQDIPKGSPVFQLPAEMALNLGDAKASKEPFRYALAFLAEFHNNQSQLRAYLNLLPMKDDGWTTTDHWSNEDLQMLQWDPVIEETKTRQEAMKKIVQDLINSEQKDQYEFLKDPQQAYEELRWAVSIVLSRCLTVHGDGINGEMNKLLIPFLDMFNHEAGSSQVLSGRAAPGGKLSVIAGRDIRAGEQVMIEYFGGGAANDRFLQDHGFLDLSPATKQRDRDTFKPQIIPVQGLSSWIEKLQATGIQEDQKLLKTEDLTDIQKLAVQYRVQLKRSLDATLQST